jgi:hypothetical protein
VEDEHDMAGKYGAVLIKRLLNYYEAQPKPEFTLTVPVGQHRIITRNIKGFPSEDITRRSMNSICIHLNDEDDIRFIATEGRALAVFEIPGKFDKAISGTWTILPDMLYAPPYGYESVTFAFSKEVVSVSVHGVFDDPVITAYDVALEWQKLRDLRSDLKEALAEGRKDQEEVDEAIAKCLEEGPNKIFPNYERVIPSGYSEKIILDKSEITIGLEKLKRSLYSGRYDAAKVFIIDALDPKNIFLTSMTGVDDSGVTYIDTKLPLKKAEVSKPIRAMITKESFEKCCLEGGDKIEISVKNARTTFVLEGFDFYKGCSVKVKKLFMPFGIPATFSDDGADPAKSSEPDEPEESKESED